MMNQEKKPNIIIIFADDLGYGDLGCYGSKINETPTLDKMAEEGKKFSNFYVSSPVCSPSRASLISGQYPHNHGVMINTHIAPAWTGGLGENKITFITTLQ